MKSRKLSFEQMEPRKLLAVDAFIFFADAVAAIESGYDHEPVVDKVRESAWQGGENVLARPSSPTSSGDTD